MGLNEFLELALDKRSLGKLAARLGSDVAFFLNGPIALCTGKGEKVKKLENFNFLALLILPDVSVSTKEVYANYRANRPLYEKLGAQINTLIEKNKIDLVSKMCANMLEKTCFSLYKGPFELKAKIESSGVGPCCLSGSGSAMFCIVEGADEERCRKNRRKLEEEVNCKSITVSNNRW